jgi:uncharacterized protein (DUF1697 family)
MKFIALLRGINVGGNNRVPMIDLKACFEKLDFKNVITYINSGNVIFETDITDKVQLVSLCELAIEKQFGFHVICSVISAEELKQGVANAPSWWGNDSDSSHNAIFVIAPETAKSIMQQIGEEKPEYEKVAAYEPIIFWSAPVKTFGRTRYSKIVGTKAYKSITIRNANTTRKLAELVG